MAETKIKLLIADDHSILRHGVRRILEAEPDMTVVGEAATGAEAVKRAKQLKPDIVILDISMPEQDGIACLRQMLKSARVHVLILSVHLEYQIISDAVSAGARGYLAKDSLDTELIAAVRTVAMGGTVFSTNVVRLLASNEQRRSSRSNTQLLQGLTAREREILLLLAEGNTPTQVARSLFVSPKTVHTHRQHILEKLDLNTTTELIRFALREGLIRNV